MMKLGLAWAAGPCQAARHGIWGDVSIGPPNQRRVREGGGGHKGRRRRSQEDSGRNPGDARGSLLLFLLLAARPPEAPHIAAGAGGRESLGRWLRTGRGGVHRGWTGRGRGNRLGGHGNRWGRGREGRGSWGKFGGCEERKMRGEGECKRATVWLPGARETLEDCDKRQGQGPLECHGV